MVCGQVNARNQFGGYSGWQYFVATPEGAAIIDNPHGDSMDATDSGKAPIMRCIKKPVLIKGTELCFSLLSDSFFLGNKFFYDIKKLLLISI